jgi:hypothetical protein
MKKTLTLTLALAMCLSVVACANKTTNPPPAPPTGSLNSFDADTNTALQTIHAFVGSMVAQNNSGAITLTVNQKALLNQLVASVNSADVIYQAWHAAGGTGPTAPVQTAVAKAQSDQNTLNAAITGGK